MSLSALSIALQGLGYALTPIAIAVQGLIAELEEEQLARQGGSMRSVSVVQEIRTRRVQAQNEALIAAMTALITQGVI